MGFLDRIENLIQGMVEGSTSNVLKQKIKPVEIENRLERAMRDNAQPSRGSKIAPNDYTVWLHPDSFRETIAGVEGYNRRCEMLLNQVATQHGFTLLHPRITVAFDTDAGLARRDIRVDAGFDAPGPTHMHTQRPAQNVAGNTQIIQTAPPPAPADATAAISSPWNLQVLYGKNANQIYPIPVGEVTLGRSSDCDIVLNDDGNTVSRQHARIFNRGGSDLAVQDLSSKNGTKVNGNYIPSYPETMLNDGTELTLGNCIVRIQTRRPQGGW